PLRVIRPGIPEELSLLVDKALAREKRDRYANGSEFVAALDASRFGKRTANRAFPFVLAIAAIAVVIAGALIMTWSRRDTPVAQAPATKPTVAEPLSSDSIARELYRV